MLRRGCSLLRIGPVASAENTLTEPPTIDGSTAIVKYTMPSPPIHCVSERQKSSPFGRASTSLMTVAPVVVKPDMVSKKASVNDSGAMVSPGGAKSGQSRNGIMPKKEKSSHVAVTTK